MRYTQALVEAKEKRINKDKKRVRVGQRNDYWAIDNGKGNTCYQCGLTTKEAYLVLKGITIGLNMSKE